MEAQLFNLQLELDVRIVPFSDPKLILLSVRYGAMLAREVAFSQ